MRLLAFALFAGLAWGANTPDAQAVYILPMTGGLDQYLANRVAGAGLFRVVTDPKLADAVFTDHLGASFEQKLNELLPPPKAQTAKEDKDDGRPQRREYSGGAIKNTIFLVDLKSRAVIWSGYEKRGSATPSTLDREAIRIVHRIEKLRKEK